eukprot:9107951-Pyramimonas_sp.AAC.1
MRWTWWRRRWWTHRRCATCLREADAEAAPGDLHRGCPALMLPSARAGALSAVGPGGCEGQWIWASPTCTFAVASVV